MSTSRFLPVVAMTACVSDLLPSDLPPPRPFAACFALIEPLDDPYGAYQGPTVTLSGPVLDAGVSAPPGDCFAVGGTRFGAEPVEDEAWWIRARDAREAEWVVGVWFADGAGEPPAVGQEIAAELSYAAMGFSPPGGWIDLRDSAGAGLAWVGVGGGLADLPEPPGLTLARGEEAGRGANQCGAWASHDLEVNGQVVEYGAVSVVDGYEVHHGGFDRTTRQKDCLDAYGAYVAVGVLPEGRPAGDEAR